VQDSDTIAYRFCFGKDVGRQEHRPPLLHTLLEHLTKASLDQGVEARRRLVEDEEIRIVLQGDDEPHLLARAMGKELDLPRQVLLVQAEGLQQAWPQDRGPPGPQARKKIEKRPRREVAVEPQLPGQVADALADPGVLDGCTQQAHGPPVSAHESHQDPKCRGLACPVGAEVAENFPLLEGEAHAAQGADAAVVLVQVRYFKGEHWQVSTD